MYKEKTEFEVRSKIIHQLKNILNSSDNILHYKGNITHLINTLDNENSKYLDWLLEKDTEEPDKL